MGFQVPNFLWCCPPVLHSYHNHFPPAYFFLLSLLTCSCLALFNLRVLVFTVPLVGGKAVFCPSVLVLHILLCQDGKMLMVQLRMGFFVSASQALLRLSCNFSLTLQRVQQGAIDAGSHPVIQTSKPSLRIITKKFLPRINEWLMMMNRYSLPLSPGVW